MAGEDIALGSHWGKSIPSGRGFWRRTNFERFNFMPPIFTRFLTAIHSMSHAVLGRRRRVSIAPPCPLLRLSQKVYKLPLTVSIADSPPRCGQKTSVTCVRREKCGCSLVKPDLPRPALPFDRNVYSPVSIREKTPPDRWAGVPFSSTASAP